MNLLPLFWMWGGLYQFSFHNVLVFHLETLGNWQYYKSIIQPYWQDAAILVGMQKMFNIFMPDELAPVNPEGGMKLDLAFNQDLRHDQLINIVEEILTGMGNDVDYLFKTHQHMDDHYEALLRYSQLPPFDGPDDNLIDHPATTIQHITYIAPSLQTSGSGYSVISSSGQHQLYFPISPGHNHQWAGLTPSGAKNMLKNEVHFPSSRASPYAHTLLTTNAAPPQFFNMSSSHFGMTAGSSIKHAASGDEEVPSKKKGAKRISLIHNAKLPPEKRHA
ncbi:hypothetical protein EDB19DRAFT_1827124 [Suillus lakei]|nr:hypothetical protein EDB19DRAFT_1827124 [Suillus lakei]